MNAIHRFYRSLPDDELWEAFELAVIGWRDRGNPDARTHGIASRLELESRGYTVRQTEEEP